MAENNLNEVLGGNDKKVIAKALSGIKSKKQAIKYISTMMATANKGDRKARDAFGDYAAEWMRQTTDLFKAGKLTEEAGDDELMEKIVKKVDKKGGITRVLDKKTRSRRATATTGLSKAKRRLIARKAVKTKKRDKSGQRTALRQRKRTLRKRKALGL